QNFKGFEDVEIELGQTVVLVGPNNSGKTTALQALALWKTSVNYGLSMNRITKKGKSRIGTLFVHRELVDVPVPLAELLWHKLQFVEVNSRKKIPITIEVEGFIPYGNYQLKWKLSIEIVKNDNFLACFYKSSFDSSLEDFINYLRNLKISFLPPMSGLTSNEVKIDRGAINVRMAEGRTAEILRNLCLSLYENYRKEDGSNKPWATLVAKMEEQFKVKIMPPYYNLSRGEIEMSYEKDGLIYDLSSSGRGQLQTLLILAFLVANPGAVFLFDEPDAHLELIRQRRTYNMLKDITLANHSQLIIASHSEVILNEAFDDDLVIGFVGKPHRLLKSSDMAQVRKSLNRIPAEDYLQAEETGWVLYLEGSTDLSILQKFAIKLNHSAKDYLSNCFVKYNGNQFTQAKDHFFGLHYKQKDLKAIVILDHPKGPLPKGESPNLQALFWERNEIENYFTSEKVLLEFAKTLKSINFYPEEVMKKSILDFTNAAKIMGTLDDPFGPNTKVSDLVLEPLMRNFYKSIDRYNEMPKSNFYFLIDYLDPADIDPEVTEKLDAIVAVAQLAKPPIF
ncbi:MAG: AAA family ATPase, partial [Candidatus Pacebacteria bacterium]|nr:AAA family ATPase [Candidatus Paceibacterota bacterium]